MYNSHYTSPKKRVQSDAVVDDSPIKEFCKVIENLPTEQWTQRCAAFQKLVSMIPESSADKNGTTMWFNSPKTLRHIALPLSELLKDARSTVVKRTCESASQLFDKCRSDARYLMKDIMPTIIGVHAQTVQVIKNSVQAMVCGALQVVPCKAAMPLWLERLKSDRNRSVREASAVYLRVSLDSWKEEEGYLTDDIWMQVGACLVRALRDPSPSVREHVKQGLHTCRLAKPELWARLINDPDGPASRDLKVQRYLSRMGDDMHQEELSIVSRSSWISTTSVRSSRGALSVSSKRSGLGPPVRISTGSTGSMKSPSNRSPSRSTMRSPRTGSSPSAFSPQSTGDQYTFEAAAQSPGTRERRRRSDAMKERWRKSSSKLGNDIEAHLLEEIGNDKPEHLRIAQQLLDYHRKHLDKVMETLRIEMDSMREFESLINNDDESVPTDSQVLDYFVSLGSCLDERIASGKELQSFMDKISEES